MLQLHDYRKFPSADMEVKFQLSSVTLEPMLRSMAYISEQLSAPANRVAVINLKVCFLYSIGRFSTSLHLLSRKSICMSLSSKD